MISEAIYIYKHQKIDTGGLRQLHETLIEDDK